MLCRGALTLRSILWLTALFYLAQTFNIDPKLSVVHTGPAGSDFGFALETIQDESEKVRIIIGAPKHTTVANSSGAVFDCTFNDPSECKELDMGVDVSGPVEQREGQRLGFSLSIEDTRPPKITACAPMWKNVRVRGNYLTQGRCHEIGYGDPPEFQKMYSPMRRLGTGALEDKLFDGPIWIKAMGESGFTVHYAKPVLGKSLLVVGTPGYFDWRGGISLVDNTTRLIYKPSVLEEASDIDSYSGYSITSGQFFSDRKVYLVVGSPNWRNIGRIQILQQNLKGRSVHTSGEFGSYYGAALCAVDVNNDYLDDLLVGAPLYSSTYEEGKVHVYQSGLLNVMDRKAPLEGPGVAGGRFGTAIGSAGDLNGDGYNDVIVGAPFVTSSGAIYIYQGSAGGLKPKPSQIILGKSIDPNLRGFGWSFSKSIDADNNGYPDLAVGAPFSNRVISLRTVPVATVKASLHIKHDMIDPSPNCRYKERIHICTEVNVGFEYTGKNCPNEMEISFALRADTLADENWELGRAQFQVTTNVLTPSILRNITLKRGVPKGIHYNVILQPRKDRYTDIGFEFRFKEIIDCKGNPAMCPIPDVDVSHVIHKQVPFAKDCGDDDVCIADLVLQTYVPESLLIGSSHITTKVVLTNKGEAAHLPTVTLKYNKLLTVRSVTEVENSPGSRVFCELSPSSREVQDRDSDTTLVCYTGHVLPRDGQAQFLISLDVSEFKTSGNTTTIDFKALTLSEELNTTLENNIVSKEIEIEMEASLEVQGSSRPEQLRFSRQKTTSEGDLESRQLQLAHQYTVANTGKGRTPGIAVTVSVPTRDRQGRQLVYITSVEATPMEGQRRSVNAECQFAQYSQAADGTSKKSPEKKQVSSDGTIYMTCGTSVCVTATCSLDELRPGEAVVISVSGWIPESLFSKHKSRGPFKLQTNAIVRVLQHSLLVPGSFQQGRYNVTTEIFGPVTTPLSTWILLVCALIVLVLLIVISLILWKIGFFKRKYRDDRKQLLQEENSSHEMESVSPTEPNDLPPNDLPPRDEQLGATGGADYVIPVSKNVKDLTKDDPYLHPVSDPYLHPVSVALPPPECRVSNVYVRSPEQRTELDDDEAALFGTRI